MASVLITGSSRGLGAEIARVYALHNFDVILHGRDFSKIQEVKRKILDIGTKCTYFVGDLKDSENIKKLSGLARDWDISVLVNNAGFGLRAELEAMNDNQMEEMIAVNLLAPMKLTKDVYPTLRKNEGTVININSVCGREGRVGRSLYCASKWGLRGFSESLKLESSGQVKILDVYPSGIRTSPEIKEGMQVEGVARKIFKAYSEGMSEIIIDGRQNG